MNKALLLTAASVLALAAGAASATQLPARSFMGSFHLLRLPKAAQILYNQNSNATGVAIDSQNFTSNSLSTYDDQGADDFVIPKGIVWTITGVDVSGAYFNGSGPAASENVIFYKSRQNGEPAGPVKHGTFNNLKGRDFDGSFAIKLPRKGLTLAAGTYWVSVIANCSFYGGCGEWGWETASVLHGYRAMWQDPGNCCCPTWGTLQNCVSNQSGPDFMFDLRGVARRK